MNLTTSLSSSVFGGFQLDSAGTNIHTEIEADGIFGKSRTTLVAQNFFDEMKQFANIEEFRNRFKRFINNLEAADSFTVDYTAEEFRINAKVILTQISERNFINHKKSVLIEVRKV